MSIQWPNLTPSRVPDLACRKRYHTLNVLRQGPPPTFARPIAYGQGVHDALKRLITPHKPLDTSGANIERICARSFASLNYPDIAEREADKLRCAASLTNYLHQHDSSEICLANEIFGKHPVTHRDGTLAFIMGAKFDCLLSREAFPNAITIRDYKTGNYSGMF